MLERAGAIDERYHKLIIRRDVVQAELDKRVITDDEIADMVCFSSDVALGLSNPTWDDKRRWLELLKTKVEVKDGTAWVTCLLRKGATPFALNTSRSLQIKRRRR